MVLPCRDEEATDIGSAHFEGLMELSCIQCTIKSPLPEWLQFVSATMLKPETPVDWRKMIAGDEQCHQGHAKALRLSVLTVHALGTAEVRDCQNTLSRLLLALRKCGFNSVENVAFPSHLVRILPGTALSPVL